MLSFTRPIALKKLSYLKQFGGMEKCAKFTSESTATVLHKKIIITSF